jgi:hypothetical protein
VCLCDVGTSGNHIPIKYIMYRTYELPKDKYECESNENCKTEIKIRNIAPLSYKLADMLPMLYIGGSIMQTNRTPSQCQSEDGCTTSYMHERRTTFCNSFFDQ